MTFANFTRTDGLPAAIAIENTCAIRQLSPDTACQVWNLSDSSPGASRGYVTVQGSFAAVTAQFGVIPLVLLIDPQGSNIAINAAFSTRVEGLPGDAVCRVTWAADAQGGYALVQGSFAAVSAALASQPPPTAAPLRTARPGRRGNRGCSRTRTDSRPSARESCGCGR